MISGEYREQTAYVTGLSVIILWSVMLKPLCSSTFSPFCLYQIANDEPPPESCPAFVSIHGQHSCSTKEMKKLLKAAAGR